MTSQNLPGGTREQARVDGAFSGLDAFSVQAERRFLGLGVRFGQYDVGVGAVLGEVQGAAREFDLVRPLRIPGLVDKALRLVQGIQGRGRRDFAAGDLAVQESVQFRVGQEVLTAEDLRQAGHHLFQALFLFPGRGRVERDALFGIGSRFPSGHSLRLPDLVEQGFQEIRILGPAFFSGRIWRTPIWT